MKPPERIALSHALVAHLHDRAPLPDWQPLGDWIEAEDWDSLMADLDEGCAVNLSWFDKSWFSDSELRAQGGKSLGDLTDDDRVLFAKHLIAQAKEHDSGIKCPTFHAYPIADETGRQAVLGCLVEIHGQGGPATVWQGAFRTRQDFVEFLRAKHIWRLDEIDDLPNNYFLSLWKFN